MIYRAEILVRFADCDPAGIVFYPRYLEMFNNLVEDWCRSAGIPFADIREGRGLGLPTVHLEVDFIAPSYMGDMLSAALWVRRIGTSSIGLQIILQAPDGSDRVRGQVVLVLMDAYTKRPVTIRDDLRALLAAYIDDALTDTETSTAR